MKTIKAKIVKEVQAVIALCMRITDETAHDAFFSYSAHVDGFSVNIHIGGYKSDSIAVWLGGRVCGYAVAHGNKKDINFVSSDDAPYLLEDIASAKNRLEYMLKTGDFSKETIEKPVEIEL